MIKKLKHSAALLCLSAALWLTGCGAGENDSSSGQFSSFVATATDGTSVDQDILKNSKVTMLNVWGTFCSPCLNEMPDLGELAEEYDSSDFQIIGIVLDTADSSGEIVQSQADKAQELIEQTGADYLHLLPSQGLLENQLSSVVSVPTTFFVDADGNILHRVSGSKEKDDWKSIIDDVLEER